MAEVGNLKQHSAPIKEADLTRRSFLKTAFGGALILASAGLPAKVAQAGRLKLDTAKGRPGLELVMLEHVRKWARNKEYTTSDNYDGRQYSASIELPLKGDGRAGQVLTATAVINAPSGTRDSLSVVYPDRDNQKQSVAFDLTDLRDAFRDAVKGELNFVRLIAISNTYDSEKGEKIGFANLVAVPAESQNAPIKIGTPIFVVNWENGEAYGNAGTIV